MKIIYYLLSCLCCIGCNSSKNPNKEKIQLTDLKGNWATNSLNSQADGDERYTLLSIYNDKECYFTPFQLCEYEIKGNKMKIIIDKFSSYDFKISMLNQNLSLIPLGRAKRDISEIINNDWNINENEKDKLIDTLYFHRIIKQNSIEIEEVLFRSSQCYGGLCESIYLRINKDRRVEYFGDVNVAKLDGYSGDVSDSLYNNLINQLHLLNINHLKNDYPVLMTDQPSWDLIIKYNSGKKSHTKIKSEGLEPPALRVVINELQSLPDKIKMTKNKEINPMSFIELGQPYLIEVKE